MGCLILCACDGCHALCRYVQKIECDDGSDGDDDKAKKKQARPRMMMGFLSGAMKRGATNTSTAGCGKSACLYKMQAATFTLRLFRCKHAVIHSAAAHNMRPNIEGNVIDAVSANHASATYIPALAPSMFADG